MYLQDATVNAASTTKDATVKAASSTTTAVSSSFANVVFMAKKVSRDQLLPCCDQL